MGADPNSVAPSKPKEKGWLDVARVSFYEILTRNDPVQPVDLILVLAGKMERKHYGLELYRSGVGPQLILSVGRFEVSKMLQLNLECIDELKSLRDQIPSGERHFFLTFDASSVRIEKAALPSWSTFGEALAFRRLWAREEWRRVMVISTDVHLRRVALTFGRVFRRMPVQFLYCPVPTRFRIMAKDNWWRQSDDRWFVISEMIKLVGYRTAFCAPDWASRRLMGLAGWGRK
jgi:uncharacterized SAM-binding protein YcdF (DUF218 family)